MINKNNKESKTITFTEKDIFMVRYFQIFCSIILNVGLLLVIQQHVKIAT